MLGRMILLFCVYNLALNDAVAADVVGIKYITFIRESVNATVTAKPSETVAIVIHGYFGYTLSYEVMSEALLRKYDKVIFIDYQTLLRDRDIDYIASKIVPVVAKSVHQKLLAAYEDRKRVHVIGHGIGAHIAGQVGRKTDGETKLEHIVGLNPLGKWFVENAHEALKCTDAKNVTILHTDFKHYGYGKKICDNDVLEFSNETQPECKDETLDNTCAHRAAWYRYMDMLIGRNSQVMTNIKKYVICLDVSQSMGLQGRIQRAKDAIEFVIANWKDESSLGFVVFETSARTVFELTILTSANQRDTMRSLVSSVNPGGYTSIGAGLRHSMNMLINSDPKGEYQKTIIFLSDGEQNRGETPEQVLPDIVRNNIRVVCLGVGAQATQQMEVIAEQTGGEVFNVLDGTDATSFEETRRKLFESLQSQKAANERIVGVMRREFLIVNERTTQSFAIDATIGKNTTVFISCKNPKQLRFQLISPTSVVFNESFIGFVQEVNGVRFDILDAAPGEWNLVVERANSQSSEQIQVVVSVTSNSRTESKGGIRLEVVVSNRTLKYPDILHVCASLRRDQFAIIKAVVELHIEGPDRKITVVLLLDNGAFPDRVKDDGIYCAAIYGLPTEGRYSLTAVARSNGSALVVEGVRDYFKVIHDVCQEYKCIGTERFERETGHGSIKLINYTGTRYPVFNPVTDLNVVKVEGRRITIVWTVPGDSFLNVSPKGFDVRIIVNNSAYDHQFEVTGEHIVQGSLRVSNKSMGRKACVVILIPESVWQNGYRTAPVEGGFVLYIVLRPIFDDRTYPYSNPAPVFLKTTDESTCYRVPDALHVVIFIVILAAAIFCVYILTCRNKKQSKSHKSASGQVKTTNETCIC